jgi:hypothetical protein
MREYDYVTLNGKGYRTTDCNAKVGDKVLIVDSSYTCGMYKDGDILTVDDIGENGVYVRKVRTEGNANGLIGRDEYLVLEPLPTLSELLARCTPENRHEEVFVDESQASPQVIDMLANLARRITSLERQLAVTQNNVERQAEELENAKHRISKHATMFGIVEEKVEMLTDDVITLDERSQVLNAINKYYAEGSR